jgi:hypothetical protein
MVRATCLVDLEAGACLELCAQAANAQDSEKLMALIKQIAALLDTKQQRLTETDSQRLKSERLD